MINKLIFKINHETNKNIIVCVLLLITICPSIIWIFLDQRVFPWDQAWYAEVSVELFYKLTQDPSAWFNGMLNAFSSKAPGIAWLGQFFVPIGQLIGSIETGLLLSILFTQTIVVILSYFCLLKLTNSRLISGISCLVISSSSLSVGLAHQYFVETLQTVSITWILLILIYLPEWKPSKIMLYLTGAFSLGMLSKITSPLYSVFSIAFILYYLFYSIKQNFKLLKWSKYFKKFDYSFFPILLLTASTFLWYGKNWQNILSFTKLASSGQASLLYGEKSDFLVKIQYWLISLQRNFLSDFLLIAIFVLFLYIIIRKLLKLTGKADGGKIRLNYFDICAIISVFQIAFVLIIFSMNINQENRYLLPLLPYITVIIAWVLERINNKVIVALIGSLFVFQLVIVNSQSMGIIPINSRFSYWLYSLDRDPIYKDMLEEVADATCSITDQEKYNIIGVEFPWFNANSASFFSAKQLPEKKFRCYYTSLGYAEKNTEKAWQRLTDLKINYFITLQFSSNFQIDAFNQVSLPILQRIKNSPTFKLIPLVDYRSILLYKRYKSKTN